MNNRPICPECGKRTIVLFAPPREGIVGTKEGYDTMGTSAYVDWNRAHLYCCNGEANCKYMAYIMTDLTTPIQPDSPEKKHEPHQGYCEKCIPSYPYHKPEDKKCTHNGTASYENGFGWRCDACGGFSGNHGGTPGTNGKPEVPQRKEMTHIQKMTVGGGNGSSEPSFIDRKIAELKREWPVKPSEWLVDFLRTALVSAIEYQENTPMTKAQYEHVHRDCNKREEINVNITPFIEQGRLAMKEEIVNTLEKREMSRPGEFGGGYAYAYQEVFEAIREME